MSRLFYLLKSLTICVFLFALISSIIISQVIPGRIRIPFYHFGNACNFPNFDPFDEQVRPYFFKVNPPNCSRKSILTYVRKNRNIAILHLKQQLLHPNINCYTETIVRQSDFLKDNTVKLIDRQAFLKRIQLDSRPVLVTCKQGENVTYMNTHQAVLITKAARKKISKAKLQDAFSVLIIGIDSVSRLNFIRSLPLTYKFLLSNNWLQFERYSIVGCNTLPNVMALLTGSTQVRNAACSPGKFKGLEKCPFIWKEFHKAGFITATAEDSVNTSTFNFQYNHGFYKKPTDYYFRPYFIASESFLSRDLINYLPYCTGPENHGERMMNLITDFITTLQQHATFSFFWMNSFSHCTLNEIGTMDRKILKFFEKLQNKILENTVVFFLSDHGLRNEDFRSTPMGWFEERLPFFFMNIPEKFQTRFKKEYKRIVKNSKELISAYDIYMTLQHILKMSDVRYEIKQSTDCPTCKSLFSDIKTRRSCEDAGIDVEWCTCLKLEAFNASSAIVEEASTFMINKLNSIIIENKIDKICSKFQLKDVVAVETDKLQNVLRLVITTYPKAVFEGTLFSRKYYGVLNYTFSGIISRIERYAPTSYCIQNKTLEPYCYCMETN